MPTYKITIERTQEVRKTLPKKWEPVGQEQKQGQFDDKIFLSTVYGYTPEVETVCTETLSIFEQCVDKLDIARVIKAINGIG